jgi:hypothetical protein
MEFVNTVRESGVNLYNGGTCLYVEAMAERSVEQMNISLERVEQLSAENTRNIAELQIYVAQVAGTVERIAIATEQRLNTRDRIN